MPRIIPNDNLSLLLLKDRFEKEHRTQIQFYLHRKKELQQVEQQMTTSQKFSKVDLKRQQIEKLRASIEGSFPKNLPQLDTNKYRIRRLQPSALINIDRKRLALMHAYARARVRANVNLHIRL